MTLRYLINKLRRFKRYINSNRVRDVISLRHASDLSLINVYSVSPLIVNLCAKNILFLLGLDCRIGSNITYGDTNVSLTNMYCSKTRLLSSNLYTIQIELCVVIKYNSLLQITCKRLEDINYDPCVLPLELIDLLADRDPIVAIRYIL
jgi:hypothetical protein